jgi:hypothetical protein
VGRGKRQLGRSRLRQKYTNEYWIQVGEEKEELGRWDAVF